MTTYRTTFMSHAHVDNRYCADLRARIQALGVDAWLDLSNMQDGHSLSSDITYELFQRQAFVALLTSASNASHWVGQELETYSNFTNDRRYRLVGGVERLIVPVLLEADLPMVVRDSETQRDRASNWAKLFRLKAIDAVGRDPQQVAQEIARALEIAAPSIVVSPPVSVPPPMQRDWDDIVLPARLDQLGFEGRRYRKTGVACIIPPMRTVAAGRFTMGSDPNDPQAYDSEKGQYSIPVDAFEIGQYPVTVAEYALYLAANPSVAKPPDVTFIDHAAVAPAWRGKQLTWDIQQQRADHPVVCVTWENVRDYCRWLAQVTGQPWRLPTEAEWEKAARWDTRASPPHARIYPWGDQWDKARANTSDGGPGMTTPIGAYASKGDASPYGCHDMAGNVWEWTSTAWYNNPPYDAAKYENDSDNVRVLRGGSWVYDPRIARAACRIRSDWDGKSDWDEYGGFRVARGGGLV
jgi:formylglycine-generating enzyme required for sulfatase activity